MTPAAKTTSTIGAVSTGDQRRLGPYSRTLRRGAIGTTIDGRSTIGRFCRDLEAQLIAHCGGSPSITQKLLIDRAIKVTVQLDRLDAKMLTEGWTDHDSRTHGGLINRQRLILRELGPPATSGAPDDQRELLRRVIERHRRAGATA